MRAQRFPAHREDGSAEVAAVFRVPLQEAHGAIERAFDGWRQQLEGFDTSADLFADPEVVESAEGFRVVFQIRPRSQLWRDWAVALVGSVSGQLEADAFVGFFDVVAGRMHAARRNGPVGSNERE